MRVELATLVSEPAEEETKIPNEASKGGTFGVTPGRSEPWKRCRLTIGRK